MGFAFLGVGGDGVDGGVRGGGVQDEGGGLAVRVVAGQDGDVAVRRCPARPARSGGWCRAGSGRGVGEHEVGAVHLVAGGAEVVPDRAEVGAAGDAVLHEPGGLGWSA